jgi:hypothetical protein
MVRVLTIIALVGVLLATGVAVASPADRVRVPVTVTSQPVTPTGSASVVVGEGDHL